MGTADFLTTAMASRVSAGDTDIDKRIYGIDVDEKAYELAIVNMILNKDGQNNLLCEDSIEHYALWQDSISVALCNPPFGENCTESRTEVLRNYDLGHVWAQDQDGRWTKTDNLLPTQQLGILFIERCYKLLGPNGRMAIILPEGYLCTSRYGFIRQWILDNLRVVALAELPRRIFLKSEADLRANIVVLQKCSNSALKKLIKANYPVFCELVRKVGYKLGKGFSVIPRRDPLTGAELRNAANELIPDSDFDGVRQRFASFVEKWKCWEPTSAQVREFASWKGGRISDVLEHDSLDLKPRRLTHNALKNRRDIMSGPHVKLGDLADVVTDTIELDAQPNAGRSWRLVEGMDIRAIEGLVVPQYPSRAWQIVQKKSPSMYQLKNRDIVIGLVRPERRNLGVLVAEGDDIVGSPDGVAIVRVKSEKESQYPLGWLFEVLRSEKVRVQFWTESGGTSYGKLTLEDIAGVLLPVPPQQERASANQRFETWFGHMTVAQKAWESIGSQDDRRPILNSPMLGLEAVDFEGESY
jgi:type I restriction enzyme M protein